MIMHTIQLICYAPGLKRVVMSIRSDLITHIEQQIDPDAGCYLHLVTGKTLWCVEDMEEVVAKWNRKSSFIQCSHVHTRGGRCHNRAGHQGRCMTREQDGITPCFFTPTSAPSPFVSSDPAHCRCWYPGWGADVIGSTFTCRHCGSVAQLVGGLWRRATPTSAPSPVPPTPDPSGPASPPAGPATRTPAPARPVQPEEPRWPSSDG